MTAEDLEHLSNLLTARVMANRMQGVKSDSEIQLATLLLGTLQGSAQIVETSYNEDRREARNDLGQVAFVSVEGATHTFTIQTWN